MKRLTKALTPSLRHASRFGRCGCTRYAARVRRVDKFTKHVAKKLDTERFDTKVAEFDTKITELQAGINTIAEKLEKTDTKVAEISDKLDKTSDKLDRLMFVIQPFVVIGALAAVYTAVRQK